MIVTPEVNQLGTLSHYNADGDLIYSRTECGFEEWYEYKADGTIHRTDSSGLERWLTYDEKGSLVLMKDSNGIEERFGADFSGNLIYPFRQIKETWL